jgi:Flp pilus assembly protein CpaB
MSAKGPVEQVEVLVAAKDLPVGTMLTREDLVGDKVVKTRKLPKEGLPPSFVINREDLMDKRLSRPVRAEETFNPLDLSKGGSITLPEGYDMISLQVGVGQAAAGFVGPGSRVNVLATVRMSNRLTAFPLLVNMLVVAVDTQTTYDKNGVFPTLSMVSFAVTQKQALLLSLAKNRGCTLELMLRHPSKTSEADKDYDIDKVEKLLSDETSKASVNTGNGTANSEAGAPAPTPAPAPKAETKVEAPAVKTVKVLFATREIVPNTEVTADLLATAFEVRELPASFAGEAMIDLTPVLGKAFRVGVAKGQWVTPGMFGDQEPKVAPRDSFNPAKEPAPEPAAPPSPSAPPPAPAKRKTHDVAVHTSSGTVIHRYEEVKPGVWKKVAELTPGQAAREDNVPDPKDEPKDEPKADPKGDPKKAD